MKKVIIFFLTALLFSNILCAQNYEWAKSIGGTTWDLSLGIAIDNNGNSYITGRFEGTVDFDPGVGIANITSVGNSDMYIAKYDASGNYLWAKDIIRTGASCGCSENIIIDTYGNLYITGYYCGTVDFDPDTGTANFSSNGSFDFFIAKYDSDGNYIFAKSIGDTGGDLGNSIAVDVTGNIYITGYYTGTVDFDLGVGTAILTSLGNAAIFIAKYDSVGNYIWANSISSSYNCDGISLALDTNNNILITGRFQYTADFDPGPGIANLTSIGSGSDIFFAKYDSNGNYLWAKSIGSLNTDTTHDIKVDVNGNCYMIGDYGGTADFDPGSGTVNLTPIGSTDIYFAKYDSNGNYLWAKSIGSKQDEYGYSITFDAIGYIYLAGSFADTCDFDPNTGIANLISNGTIDIFFAKYDATGNYIWAKSVGGISDDYGQRIVVDNNGYIYITGDFRDTCDFDPNVGIVNLASNGSFDIFIAKYYDITVETNEYNSSLEVSIFPNPTNDIIKINLADNSVIEILNINGQIVKSVCSNCKSTTADLTDLSSGVYIVRVKTDKEIITKKIIKE